MSDTDRLDALLREHRECGKPKYDGCYSHWPTPHCRADGMALPCDVMQIAEVRAGTPAPHDCFWDAQPVKAGKPVDVESLRLDVSDAEADAFLAAIEEASAPAPLDVERLARAIYRMAWNRPAPYNGTGKRTIEVGDLTDSGYDTPLELAAALAREYAKEPQP